MVEGGVQGRNGRLMPKFLKPNPITQCLLKAGGAFHSYRQGAAAAALLSLHLGRQLPGANCRGRCLLIGAGTGRAAARLLIGCAGSGVVGRVDASDLGGCVGWVAA